MPVLGRLGDLQYIFAVASGSPSIWNTGLMFRSVRIFLQGEQYIVPIDYDIILSGDPETTPADYSDLKHIVCT